MNMQTYMIFYHAEKKGKQVANTTGSLQGQTKSMFFVAIAAQGKPFGG